MSKKTSPRVTAIFVLLCATVFLVSLLVFPAAKSSQLTKTPIYRAVSCSSECTFDETGLKEASKAATQNIFVTVFAPGCSLSTPWDPLGRGSIIVRDLGHNVMIELPIVGGGVTYHTDISLPRPGRSCKIQILIEDSRKFLVYLNGTIAYVMRYNEPVMTIGNWRPVPEQTVDGTIRVQGIDGPSQFQQSWEFLDVVVATTTVLVAITLSTLKFSRRTIRSSNQSVPK